MCKTAGVDVPTVITESIDRAEAIKRERRVEGKSIWDIFKFK